MSECCVCLHECGCVCIRVARLRLYLIEFCHFNMHESHGKSILFDTYTTLADKISDTPTPVSVSGNVHMIRCLLAILSTHDLVPIAIAHTVEQWSHPGLQQRSLSHQHYVTMALSLCLKHEVCVCVCVWREQGQWEGVRLSVWLGGPRLIMIHRRLHLRHF